MIAVINESTALTDAEVQSYLPAYQTQVSKHFGPIWGFSAPLQFFEKGDPGAAPHWQLVFLDNSDQAGALGYHDVTSNDLPLGKVFAATAKQYNNSVSVTGSHELLEMLGDPQINMTATVTDNTGAITALYAYEACDACEDDKYAYEIDGVLVSDFIYPSWFDVATTKTKLDYTGNVTKPLEILAGGYAAVWTPGNGWSQRTGADKAGRYEAIPNIGSRRERRMRGRGKWLVSGNKAAAA
jgi:hypothetical protein